MAGLSFKTERPQSLFCHHGVLSQEGGCFVCLFLFLCFKDSSCAYRDGFQSISIRGVDIIKVIIIYVFFMKAEMRVLDEILMNQC